MIEEFFRQYFRIRKKCFCFVQLSLVTIKDFFFEKSQYWSKIEILVKNLNIGEESKYWGIIEILVKNFSKFLKISCFIKI